MFTLGRFLVLSATLFISTADDINEDIRRASMCLTQFGYLLPPQNLPYFTPDPDFFKALIDFQRIERLKITGEVDKETKEKMKLPRCTVKDNANFPASLRSKRFAVQNSRWTVETLTYKITKYSTKLNRTTTDDTVREAFNMWARVVPLTFKQKSNGSVHIDVTFVRGDHGSNCSKFQDGILGHTSGPDSKGEVHINDETSETAQDLLYVAVHEIGHALGLKHSLTPEAIMYACITTNRNNASFDLHDDDIKAIQMLYGANSSVMCDDTPIDAVFRNYTEDKTYVFKGRYYWELAANGSIFGPRLISYSWKEVPGNIDAAITFSESIIFFRGAQYWNYTSGNLIHGNISKVFIGVPDHLDAVMNHNKEIYFFKGFKYWKLTPKPDTSSSPHLEEKIISSTWKDVNKNLNAAFHDENGEIHFFFKDSSFIRFSPNATEVNSAWPPYPRPVSYWWFHCYCQNKDNICPVEPNSEDF